MPNTAQVGLQQTLQQVTKDLIGNRYIGTTRAYKKSRRRLKSDAQLRPKNGEKNEMILPVPADPCTCIRTSDGAGFWEMWNLSQVCGCPQLL